MARTALPPRVQLPTKAGVAGAFAAGASAGAGRGVLGTRSVSSDNPAQQPAFNPIVSRNAKPPAKGVGVQTASLLLRTLTNVQRPIRELPLPGSSRALLAFARSLTEAVRFQIARASEFEAWTAVGGEQNEKAAMKVAEKLENVDPSVDRASGLSARAKGIYGEWQADYVAKLEADERGTAAKAIAPTSPARTTPPDSRSKTTS